MDKEAVLKDRHVGLAPVVAAIVHVHEGIGARLNLGIDTRAGLEQVAARSRARDGGAVDAQGGGISLDPANQVTGLINGCLTIGLDPK